MARQEGYITTARQGLSPSLIYLTVTDRYLSGLYLLSFGRNARTSVLVTVLNILSIRNIQDSRIQEELMTIRIVISSWK